MADIAQHAGLLIAWKATVILCFFFCHNHVFLVIKKGNKMYNDANQLIKTQVVTYNSRLSLKIK